MSIGVQWCLPVLHIFLWSYWGLLSDDAQNSSPASLSCSSAHPHRSLFSADVSTLTDCWLGHSMLLESQHGGTKSYTLIESKNTQWNGSVKTNLSISLYVSSEFICFSPNVTLSDAGRKLIVHSFKHIHMHTLFQSHMQNCVLAGQKEIIHMQLTQASFLSLSLSLFLYFSLLC